MTDREIFMNAPIQASAKELESYLTEACGDDAVLRSRLNAMFAVAQRKSGFMEAPEASWRRSSQIGSEDEDELIGDTIGNYNLLQEIGRGGFGIVYMAEQWRPVKRCVALKILKLGMDTKQVIARFEAERQALAMMEHPNIAKVFDAGETDMGRPYFVMELVKGVSITQYCDNHHLTTEQRLRLFLKVCDAIQHAHQKGIIHRDIKPSNVLITMHGDEAMPKVIDFGVAKAIHAELTDETLVTRYEQFIGTPAYMSPEQTPFSGLDIDTRSDIYALGVLLYELLTGETPFDAKELDRVGQDKIRRRIREMDPPKPSTRVRRLTVSSLTELANYRSVEPRRLRVQLRGDLDWIVMKALEKDRARRYESASGLAADIGRHLNHEPVLAAAPSSAYRFAKFARKHRVALLVTGSIMGMLSIGIIVSSLFAIESTRAKHAERDAKMALSKQLLETDTAKQTATFRLAEELLQSGKTIVGVAHLAAIVREYPENGVYAERLLSALTMRNFPRQLVKPMGRDATGTPSAMFSPDGSKVITGSSSDSKARIWNALTGERLLELRTDNRYVHYAEFSPDGRRVLTASGGLHGLSGGSLQIWDAQSGELLSTIVHKKLVEVARFSPGGERVFSGSDDGMLKITDVESGELLASHQHSNSIIQGAFCPLGSARIVTASIDKTARILDADNGRIIHQLNHDDRVWSARFSNDGRRIVTGCEDGSAYVWDAATGEKLSQTLKHDERVFYAEFSHDGRLLATASFDGTARLWEVTTGLPTTDSLWHKDTVWRVHFDHSGDRIVTYSSDGTAQVWDVLSGNPIGGRLRHQEPVLAARFSPNGMRVVTASIDGTTRLWEAPVSTPNSLVLRSSIHSGYVRRGGRSFGTFSDDGRQIATIGSDRYVRIWDSETGHESVSPRTHGGVPSAIRITPGGKHVITSTLSKGVRIWDMLEDKVIHQMLDQESAIIDVSPDGKMIVAAPSNGPAFVWDVETGEQVSGPLEHHDEIRCVRFSASGELVATGSVDQSAKIWRSDRGELITSLNRHTELVRTIAFSPDDRRLVTGSDDHSALIWDCQTGEVMGQPLRHGGRIKHAAFSPDGKRVLTASANGLAQLWNAETGLLSAPAMRHESGVDYATFSPDGLRVATASRDGTGRVWDSETGLPVSEPLLHEDWVTYAEFSPDGQKLITAGDDATVRVWSSPSLSLPVPQWFPDWAEAVVGNKLEKNGVVVAMDWESIERITHRAKSQAGDDVYARAARWYYADPNTREVSPD